MPQKRTHWEYYFGITFTVYAWDRKSLSLYLYLKTKKPHWRPSKKNQTYNYISFIHKHNCENSAVHPSNLGNSGLHSSSELNFIEVKMLILTTNAKSMFISAAHEKLRREKKSEFLCKDFNFLTFQTFPNSRHRYQEIRNPFQRFELSCSQGPLTFPSSTL